MSEPLTQDELTLLEWYLWPTGGYFTVVQSRTHVPQKYPTKTNLERWHPVWRSLVDKELVGPGPGTSEPSTNFAGLAQLSAQAQGTAKQALDNLRVEEAARPLLREEGMHLKDSLTNPYPLRRLFLAGFQDLDGNVTPEGVVKLEEWEKEEAEKARLKEEARLKKEAAIKAEEEKEAQLKEERRNYLKEYRAKHGPPPFPTGLTLSAPLLKLLQAFQRNPGFDGFDTWTKRKFETLRTELVDLELLHESAEYAKNGNRLRSSFTVTHSGAVVLKEAAEGEELPELSLAEAVWMRWYATSPTNRGPEPSTVWSACKAPNGAPQFFSVQKDGRWDLAPAAHVALFRFNNLRIFQRRPWPIQAAQAKKEVEESTEGEWLVNLIDEVKTSPMLIEGSEE